jgi:hypothetical protein
LISVGTCEELLTAKRQMVRSKIVCLLATNYVNGGSLLLFPEDVNTIYLTKISSVAGSVAKDILAAISCAQSSDAASLSCVAGKFLQHYR